MGLLSSLPRPAASVPLRLSKELVLVVGYLQDWPSSSWAAAAAVVELLLVVTLGE